MIDVQVGRAEYDFIQQLQPIPDVYSVQVSMIAYPPKPTQESPAQPSAFKAKPFKKEEKQSGQFIVLSCWH